MVIRKNPRILTKTDQVPVRAMHYLAKKHIGFTAKKNEPLPRHVYRQILKILEEEY